MGLNLHRRAGIPPTEHWPIYIVTLFQERRDKFTEDLEIKLKKVDDYATYGDLDHIYDYYHKAKDLDTYLQVAADIVSADFKQPGPKCIQL